MKRIIITAAIAATLGAWTAQADEAVAYTVVAIGEANALTSNKIEAGATLQIPQ